MFCSKILVDADKYEEEVQDINNTGRISCSYLGMGVAETWRGVPDGQSRGITLENDIPLLLCHGSGAAQDDGSNGISTVCKAKLKIHKQKHLPQVVKTCVVSSFVEANLHPKLNTMVPTILLDTTNALVVLYCSRHNLILISDIFCWREEDRFCKPGVTFLWAMINHRYEILIV